jgi:hypothetical protein
VCQRLHRFRISKCAKARVCLLCLGIAVIVSYVNSRPPHIPSAGFTGPDSIGDIALYRMIADQTRSGAGYYDVVGKNLLQHGYAVRPVFHWRLPTLNYVLVVLGPFWVAAAVLVVLALVNLFVWVRVVRMATGLRVALLLVGLLAFQVAMVPLGGYLLHETWAGVLVALSLGLYCRNPALSVGAGLSALFLRELALPYVLVMLAVAVWERRTKESLAWMAGLGLWIIYFAWHVHMVGLHMIDGPADPSWLRFSGWSQAVACVGWAFATLMPRIVVSTVAVFGLVGAAASRNLRLAVVVIGYAAGMMVFGKPFNHYWGLMFVPLLVVGFAYSIHLTDALIREAINRNRACSDHRCEVLHSE